MATRAQFKGDRRRAADGEWVVVEVLNEAGNAVERGEGPTIQERAQAHAAGTCDAMCSICYHEAAQHSEGEQEEQVNPLVAGYYTGSVGSQQEEERPDNPMRI